MFLCELSARAVPAKRPMTMIGANRGRNICLLLNDNFHYTAFGGDLCKNDVIEVYIYRCNIQSIISI